MAKRTKFHAKKVADAINEAVRKPMGPLEKAAIAVENEAKISMKSGGGTAKTPSPVGTPPHTQEGPLRAGIQHAATSLGISQVVGPTEIYGKFHEFSEKFPRKFMAPALMRALKKFPKLFKGIPIASTRSGRWLNRQ